MGKLLAVVGFLTVFGASLNAQEESPTPFLHMKSGDEQFLSYWKIDGNSDAEDMLRKYQTQCVVNLHSENVVDFKLDYIDGKPRMKVKAREIYQRGLVEIGYDSNARIYGRDTERFCEHIYGGVRPPNFTKVFGVSVEASEKPIIEEPVVEEPVVEEPSGSNDDSPSQPDNPIEEAPSNIPSVYATDLHCVELGIVNKIQCGVDIKVSNAVNGIGISFYYKNTGSDSRHSSGSTLGVSNNSEFDDRFAHKFDPWYHTIRSGDTVEVIVCARSSRTIGGSCNREEYKSSTSCTFDDFNPISQGLNCKP